MPILITTECTHVMLFRYFYIKIDKYFQKKAIVYFCEGCGFREAANLDSTDLFILIFGASFHDYDHTGTNNLFLNNTGHAFALKYNDRSPLENHHVS